MAETTTLPLPPTPARFWLIQAGLWLGLAAVMFVPSYSMFSETIGATALQVSVRSLWWAGAGFVLTSALSLLFTRRLSFARQPVKRLLSMFAASLVGGAVWAALVFGTYWPLPMDPGSEEAHKFMRERFRPPDETCEPAAEADVPKVRPMESPASPPRGADGPVDEHAQNDHGDKRPRPPKRFEYFGPVAVNTLILFVWVGAFLMVQDSQRLQRESERSLKANALAAEARFDMLRYELNPHFLFNALNSVIGAIDEDPKRAQAMIQGMSELLRYTLKGNNETTLRDELEVIRTYLGIEQVRFEERLHIEWDVDPEALSTKIPAMLIHPLVENAVKYGMETSKMPLHVWIRVRGGETLTIEISNTGKLHPPRQGAIGLRNLGERLAHRYPNRHQFSLTEADGRVTARLTLQEDT